MAPVRVSEGFLIDTHEYLTLVLHWILWEFPNEHTTQGGFFWSWWASLVLSRSWIFWGGIKSRNGSVYGAKPGSTYHHVPKGLQLTTACPCPPLWYCLLYHICQTPPSWWRFRMCSRLELGGLLLPPGSRLGPKWGFSRCLSREPLCCAPI